MEQLRPTESTNLPQNIIFNNSNDNTSVISQSIVEEKRILPDSKSREFSIDEMKEAPSKIKIDFTSAQDPNAFIKQPTESARQQPAEGSQPQYINPMPMNNGAMGTPINPEKAKEALASNIRVGIAIIDYLMGILAIWLYKEGTSSQYTADAPSKKLLETAMVEYAYEKQIKMSPGVALFGAFMAAYGFMILKGCKAAFERMQEKKKYKVGGTTTNPTSPNISTTKSATQNIPQQTTYNKSTVTQTEIRQKPTVSDSDMIRFQNINPPVKAPVIAPPIESVYTQNFDGTVTPKNLPKWFNPDPKIIAKSRKELMKYVSDGIYPMWLKNVSNNNTRKQNYDVNTGEPKFMGKPARKK